MSETGKFVVFPLGSRRYAVPASRVTELSMSGSVQRFPQTTPSLAGVLLRRGQVIAVCDVAHVLEPPGSERRLFLIAECTVHGHAGPVAVPVTGECMLAEGTITSGSGEEQFSLGSLTFRDETVSVLDLDSLIAHCTGAMPARAAEIVG